MASSAVARTRQAHERSDGGGGVRLLRKNAGAVQIWNSISLLQRKTFAVLLFNAYEDLPDFGVVSHEIPLGVLTHLLGFNSNNTQYLKEALTGMVSTPLQWNVQRIDGKDAWAVSATLAAARIEDGVVHYSFSHELRKRLYNPEVYAQLDLMVIRAFKSGYALALYENCKLFAGEGETPDFDPHDLRGLLGAGDNPAYENFGRFMDKVIKPATREVNKLSELHLEPVLTREARRVTKVRFKVEENGEAEGKQLPASALQGRDADLAMRIQSDIGLTYAQVVKLFEEYEDSHLMEVFNYVRERYTQGKVQKGKIAGYFMTTLKRATPGSLAPRQSALDLPPTPPERTKEELAAEAAAAAEKEARKKLLAAVEVEWQEKPADEQKALLDAFMAYLAEENRIVYDSLRRKRDLSPGTLGHRFLLQWLVDRSQGQGEKAA